MVEDSAGHTDNQGRIEESVDYAIAQILGLYCSRCQRVTTPYIGEGESNGYGGYADEWPCCPGCWQRYPE